MFTYAKTIDGRKARTGSTSSGMTAVRKRKLVGTPLHHTNFRQLKHQESFDVEKEETGVCRPLVVFYRSLKLIKYDEQ